MRRLLVLFFAFALVAVARAQSVRWEGSPDDPSQVQLIFEDCSPDGDPRLPAIADSSLSLVGNSSNTSIVNGTFSRSSILIYSVRTRRQGATLQIPAFTVQTNKGPKVVSPYSGAAGHVISDDIVNSRLVPGADSVWVGEVFPLAYTLDVARRSYSQPASQIDWTASPLVAEEFSQLQLSEAVVNGESRVLVTSRTRAYAKSPGTVAINPTTQLMNIATGSIGFGLFQQQRIEQLSVSSKRREITVKPLPAPPEGFTGAVGEFKLASKVVPTSSGVGEPITWTLELSGTGNWPDIAGLPQREVSKDFQVVQPQARRTPVDGKLFDVTLSEDVVLVPTHPGTYVLNPINFVYFDPKTGEYKTLSTPRTTVTVTAGSIAAPGARIQVGPAPGETPPPSTTPATPAPEVAPASPATAIPRNSLPRSGDAAAPWTVDRIVTFSVIPFAAALVIWIALAIQRAQATDPGRARREARARLADTLAKLPRAEGARRSTLLLAWQHDAAILWQVRHAAPPYSALGDEAWRQLWRESDRALYHASGELPSDWVARAQAALQAKRAPSFSPFSALRLRNLAPFLVLAAIAAFAPKLRAQDGEVAYQAGHFAEAEHAWAAVVAKSPVNPAARYNLSLALAQQDHWDASLAQATAAFVQDPANARIRWQFELAADKAGFLPAPLAPFIKPGPLQSLARLASPADWQRWIVVASGVAALAIVLLLVRAYRRRFAWLTPVAIVLLALSVITLGSAISSLLAYGPTADARAVIVWRGSVLRSIPTEADTTQKSTTLAAGSVAVLNNTFLDWDEIAFENGQTGWVPKSDVVPLWR